MFVNSLQNGGGLTPKVFIPVLTSAQIVAWNCNFPSFWKLWQTDRPTNQQTDMRGHREVTLPITRKRMELVQEENRAFINIDHKVEEKMLQAMEEIQVQAVSSSFPDNNIGCNS